MNRESEVDETTEKMAAPAGEAAVMVAEVAGRERTGEETGGLDESYRVLLGFFLFNIKYEIKPMEPVEAIERIRVG